MSRKHGRRTIGRVADLFDDYRLATATGIPAWDEMFEEPPTPRPSSASLYDALQALSASDFDQRCAVRDRTFRDQGITFSLSGEERPFPLDLVPRVIPAAEWATIEAGVTQRVQALEAFLADLYGGHGQALEDVPANGVRVHVAGIDLVRDADGIFKVLEDNLRTPSGISYVVENRRTMARVFPELFASHRVRPVGGYPARLLEALRASACQRGEGDPNVVVLTPGIYNSAYFEHSFLARQMGVELVEGCDLVCRDDVLYMRTTEGEQRVDVVYRRVDDTFLDPVHFRPDSLVGCPGILNAARSGNVTIANAVGNGVADDKLMYTYVPALIEYYLGEKALLPNVATYRLEDPDERAEALARLDQLVVKPVDASGGYGIVVGPVTSDETLERGHAPQLHRSKRGHLVHLPHQDRRSAPGPPRRPPTFRGERRHQDLGGAGRPHPGRPPRTQPGGELEPGRRLEGHLGPGRGQRRAGRGDRPGRRRPGRAAHRPVDRRDGQRRPQPAAATMNTSC